MKRKLLTKAERKEIDLTVRYYLDDRRVLGTFWDFYQAVRQAMVEIDYHRTKGKKK